MLIDLSARNLSSAVAGGIDQIAAIQLVMGLRIGAQANPGGPISLGVIGVDVTPINGSGQGDYLDANGNPIPTPVLNGALVDGAVVAKKVVINTKRNDPNLSGRVFVPS
jgi:hypothetical protein